MFLKRLFIKMKIPENKNYLFLCSANISRSPYAASWFSDYCKKRRIEVNVESAGMNVMDTEEYYGRTPVQLTEGMAREADFIFVMEGWWMTADIHRQYPDLRARISDLDIPDVFRRSHDDSLLFYDLSPEEAAEFLEKHYNDPNLEIGTVMFEKILEGKLERILC